MINGAFMNVDAWLKYRKQLAAGWSRDVDRLLREENRRRRERRARGIWGAFFK